MSFFEPPPPPSEPPRERPSPSWAGAPTNEIGSPVPLRLVLARTEQVAVVLVGGTAYTTGVVLGLAVRSRRHASDGPYDSIDFLDFPFGSPHRRGHPPDELPDDLLRFGVEFSDGGRATTVGGTTRLSRGEPTGPLLMEADASMSEGTWDGEFWLWPLPPPARSPSQSSGPQKGCR